MSFKDKIIKKILQEEKEKFLSRLIQDPPASLKAILHHYGIPFETRGENIVVPVTTQEEIIISIKKQKQKIE
jgi:hypothetical protein